MSFVLLIAHSEQSVSVRGIFIFFHQICLEIKGLCHHHLRGDGSGFGKSGGGRGIVASVIAKRGKKLQGLDVGRVLQVGRVFDDASQGAGDGVLGSVD
jgi:hypothetical protein